MFRRRRRRPGGGSIFRIREASTLAPAAARTPSAPLSAVPIGPRRAHGALNWRRQWVDNREWRRRNDGGRFQVRRADDGCGRLNLLQAQHLLFHVTHYLVVLFVVFEEVRNVKEGIALQADIDERRLHARQHTRYPAFVNAARQRVFLLALKIDLR